MAKLIIATDRKHIHKELCKCLEQAIEYGNYSSLMDAVGPLKKGVTRTKILLWIETYSPLRLASIKPIRFKMSADGVKDYKEAILTPYWEVKLPVSTNMKTDIKSELNACMQNFIKDPSDTAHTALLKVIENYKIFGNLTAKKKMKITPANLVQGGMPGSRR